MEIILVFLGIIVVVGIAYVVFNVGVNRVKCKFAVVLDTETSSLDYDKGEVLQLSAIKVDLETNKIVDYFDYYIKPSSQIRIDESAMEITGISLARCKAPKAQVFTEFNQFCVDSFVVGYNVKFDINQIDDDMVKAGIRPTYKSNGYKDVLYAVKNANLPTRNNKLVTVSRYYKYRNYDAHNSLADCLATYYVWRRVEGIEMTYEQFQEFYVPQNLKNYIRDKYVLKTDLKTINKDKCKELFEGKKVCITGSFEFLERADLEKAINNNGGKVQITLSKHVDIFIQGFNVRPTTNEKKFNELSEEADIRLIKESELIELICDN